MTGPQQFAFRVDASLAIGTGHVMRCLTLADALAADGARCRFVCREQPGHRLDAIARRGHEALALTGPAGPAAEDSAATLLALCGSPTDWLVVDHYGLDVAWESAVRPHCRSLMVIDDLADRPHDCDLLLDQNLRQDAEQRYRLQVPAHCDLRLGPTQVLLRPDFDEPPQRDRNGEVRRVFVYFGGNDVHNQAGMAIAALAGFPALRALVVLGADHPHREAIRAAASGQARLQVVDSHDDMAGAMADADLALGVCGIAAWERCAMGLPSIVCVTADNQREDAEALHRLGAALCLGDAAGLTVAHWALALRRLTGEPAVVARMAAAAAGVVEGHRDNRHRLIQQLRDHGR